MSELRLYKPSKEGNGAASKIQLVDKIVEKDGSKFNRVMMFWVAAQQNGKDEDDNAKFFWEPKEGRQVTMKLGDPDVGEILAVLNGNKKEAGSSMGLFHKNENGNSSLQFKANIQRVNDKDVVMGYYVRLAFQDKTKKVTEVKHSITLGEAEVLKLVFERYVLKKYW